MRLMGELLLVCFLEITAGQTLLVPSEDPVPQAPAGLCAAVADDQGHRPSCATRDGRPQPAFALLLEHEGPQLVQFQHVISLSGQQSVLESRQSAYQVSPYSDQSVA